MTADVLSLLIALWWILLGFITVAGLLTLAGLGWVVATFVRQMACDDEPRWRRQRR